MEKQDEKPTFILIYVLDRLCMLSLDLVICC